jgi:hypothetical protein
MKMLRIDQMSGFVQLKGASFITKAVLGATSVWLASGILASVPAQAMTLVDSELILSVDVSGSVDSSEFNLQRQGYVNALLNPTVQNRITSLPNGLAVAVSYWSSDNLQNLAVPWTLLRNATDATNFANLITATTRPFSGLTAIGNAISYAQTQLLTNDFDGNRLIIDISGDGRSNDGISVTTARDAAVAAGITINGLPILTDDSTLDTYYLSNVIGGPGAFVVSANTFSDFDAAVAQKIGREITPGPAVPTPALLPALLGMGAAALRKRKGEAAEAEQEAVKS